MRKLAEWVAAQEVTPDPDECYEMAIRFSGVHLPSDWVLTLLEREDWLTYRDQMALDPQIRVRKKLEHGYEKYVDAHLWALEAAQGVGDYKTVAEMANPILDRVAPKRDQHQAISQNVVIHVSHGSPLQQTEPIEVEILPVTEDTP